MKSNPPLKRKKSINIYRLDNGMNRKLPNSKTISIKNLLNNLKDGADNPIILDKKKNDEIKDNNLLIIGNFENFLSQ